jgi:hypothetical protein
MLIKENRTKKIENREETNKKSSFIGFVFFLFSIFFSLTSQAQCAMCRASLESQGNEAQNEALNDGIVYLMAIPYILFAGTAYIVYRIYSKRKS